MKYSSKQSLYHVNQYQRFFPRSVDCFIQGSWVPILRASSNPPTLPNSGFGYILTMFYTLSRYSAFPRVNSLDTVMCSQLLNNDYGILETDLYCHVSGIVGRSTLYLQVPILLKIIKSLMGKYMHP